MSLSHSDVKRVANLACLELTEDQVCAILDKLNRIFLLVEQMRTVDATAIEPLSHPISMLQYDLSLRLRDDVVTELNHHKEYQKVAPETKNGLYLVPKVIE